MRLELGSYSFDLTHRVLTVARFDTGRSVSQFAELIEERPAAVELGFTADGEAITDSVRDMAARFDGPLIVRTSCADTADAALRAGASGIHDPCGLRDPSILDIVAEREGALIVGLGRWASDFPNALAERLEWAIAAGVPLERLVAEAPIGVASELATPVPRLVDLGDDGTTQGRSVAAAMAGARLVATTEVAVTRRTLDTIAQLLRRRPDTTGPITSSA